MGTHLQLLWQGYRDEPESLLGPSLRRKDLLSRITTLNSPCSGHVLSMCHILSDGHLESRYSG